jgi:AraC-like DNA-binding protein
MSTSNTIAPVANCSDRAVVQFSTADYAPHRRVEAVHEILGRNLQNVHIEPLAVDSFQTAITLRQMPGLALYTASRSAARYRRSREFIEHDDVIVIFGFTASYDVQHLGRTLSMRPGESVILTGAEPAVFGGPDQHCVRLLRVPVRRLAPFVANLDAAYGHVIAADSAALRLLAGYVGVLEATGTLADPDLRRQAVAHIHDLIALTIGATRDAAEFAHCRGASAAWLRAIKQDIASRLDQPDLSLASIAVHHRVKLRWVQRLFEREGTTFTEYLLEQRLARAHRLLTDSRQRRQKISAIALDAGFGDLSYFNRAFRRHYGVTPSDVRAATASGD